jgi:phage regulator Rha-like protein
VDTPIPIQIKNRNGQLYADSRVVARVLGVEHESLIRLIKENSEDFKRVRFEIGPLHTAGGVQKATTAHIPETESLLLITYVRNTAESKIAKRALIEAFQTMRHELAKRINPPSSEFPFFDQPDCAKRLAELRRACDSKKMSIAEWRRIVLGRHTKLPPPLTHQRPDLEAFAQTNLLFAEKAYAKISDVYARFLICAGTKELSQNILTRYLKANYQVTVKQKKFDGYPCQIYQNIRLTPEPVMLTTTRTNASRTLANQ